jgi:hypothetical protein
MSGNEKSTDPGLSAAERKTLRSREAEEAIAEHESAQKAFHENRERLREERLQREAAAGPMLHPAPELPDNTLIENVRFVTRIRNALNAAGMKTIGEVRETSDDRLLSLPDLGRGSIAYLRETLGFSSTDIGLQSSAIGLDIALQRHELLRQPLARHDARLARIAVEKRAVDRHQIAAQQFEIARQHHEVPVRSLQRVPVVLAEIADRTIAEHKAPQKPDQLHIASRLALKTPRRSHLIEIAIQIELQ